MTNEYTEIAVRGMQDLMPAMTIDQASERYNTLVEFTKKLMQPNKDFGVIPGTNKPTLLKPGAEKLCTLFGFRPDFVLERVVEDWDKGFFYYAYKCSLIRGGEVVAAGIGSCNSKEKKYRWRSAEVKCPRCGKPTIRKSKNEPGWYCWRKLDGCGATFVADDQSITGQARGQVENTEPFELVNTIQKMAQKRALIAATLIGCNASEFYTQDIEDLGPVERDVVEGEVVDQQPAQTRTTLPPAKTDEQRVDGLREHFRESLDGNGKPVQPDDVLADDEKFIALIYDTMSDWHPNDMTDCLAWACKAKVPPRITSLTLEQRHKFLDALVAGKFDAKFNSKHQPTAA